jgi:hypothetical protein
VLSGTERELRCFARDLLATSVCQAAAHWKQRGKFRAIKEGDANTSFFHARASQWFRRNLVRELKVDGEVIVAHDGKAAALHRFYSDLLGRARPASRLLTWRPCTTALPGSMGL